MKEYEIDDSWINCWDPKRESKFSSLYYVVSTPILFVLNKEKKIVSKLAGDESIIALVNKLIENKGKKLIFE